MQNTKELMALARGDIPSDLLIKNARILNVYTGDIIEEPLAIAKDSFVGWGDYKAKKTLDLRGKFIIPAFIDPHIHIESSMSSISEFLRVVLARGTGTIIADPHEIANVLGKKGMEYMLSSSENQAMDIFFTLPSCVPSTDMESSGAILNAEDLAPFFKNPRILGLAEMMNFPGVIHEDKEVHKKIQLADKNKKLIDGHAPELKGRALNAYIAAGIFSDHECTRVEEALEKLQKGMHIMVREGSCAQSLEALLPVISKENSRRMMWCSDDRDPRDLLDKGHMDYIVRKAIALGLDPLTAIQMASINPAEYFGLKDRGAIAPGKRADFLIVNNLEDLLVEAVYIKGKLTAEKGRLKEDISLPQGIKAPEAMNLKAEQLDFSLKAEGKKIRVIEVGSDQLISRMLIADAKIENKMAVADSSRDILKISVIERYSGKAGQATGFVKGFGIKNGAIASSVGHDSHNLIVVGDNDEDMLIAAKTLIDIKGGMLVVKNGEIAALLPLDIAGLMSSSPMEETAFLLKELNKKAEELGCRLEAPFMRLAFLSLPVIPYLKITDKGLIDVENFKIVSPFLQE